MFYNEALNNVIKIQFITLQLKVLWFVTLKWLKTQNEFPSNIQLQVFNLYHGKIPNINNDIKTFMQILSKPIPILNIIIMY